jgi:hypothetical protein
MNDRPRLDKLTSLLIGVWLALSIAMTVVAIVNFTRLKPDRLRDAGKVFAALGDVETQKVALRYTASELNRELFDIYGKSQIVVGLLALLAAVLARRGRFLLALLALAFLSTLVFELWLVPAIIEQGRIIDFLPREPKGPEVLEFDRLHLISERLDGGKMLLLLVAAFSALIGGGRKGSEA